MSSSKKQKIVVYGLFGQSNWGNEGTLKATLEKLSAFTNPLDTEIVCVCSDPDAVSREYGLRSYPIQCPPVRFLRNRHNIFIKMIRRIFLRIPAEIIHWFKGVRFLWNSHMVIAPGTGLLNDYATGPFGRPYDILMWSILSKLNRCKLNFVSVGAGPVKSRISRLFLIWSMKLSDFRSFRDEYSKNYVLGLGFKCEDDPVFPDLAFSLAPSMFAVSDKPSNDGKTVGLGLKDYFGEEGERHKGQQIYDEYIEKMVRFIVWLLEKEYEVRLLVGDTLYDEPVKSDIYNLLGDRIQHDEMQHVLFDHVVSLEGLIHQLKSVDFIISPRFHNIIYGIMLGKPVISLAYHQKFAPIMNDLGFSEYCQDLESLDVDLLFQQFRKLIENRGNIVDVMEQKRKQYREELERQYSLLFQKYNN